MAAPDPFYTLSSFDYVHSLHTQQSYDNFIFGVNALWVMYTLEHQHTTSLVLQHVWLLNEALSVALILFFILHFYLLIPVCKYGYTISHTFDRRFFFQKKKRRFYIKKCLFFLSRRGSAILYYPSCHLLFSLSFVFLGSLFFFTLFFATFLLCDLGMTSNSLLRVLWEVEVRAVPQPLKARDTQGFW